MQKITSKDSLNEYQKKMAHNRKIAIQAKAIMGRAKNAGIPEKFMRINQKAFAEILDPSYHGDVGKFAAKVYSNPLNLMKKEFIIIDGGGVVERKMAGFAILFRLISCDKRGMHKNGGELAHQLQSIKTFEYGLSRNDITQTLRDVDLLFISECYKNDFIKNFETGRFFDEILNHRDDHVKTTILSFTHSLPSNPSYETMDNVMTEQDRFGQYMCSISMADENKDKRFVRIRVKK